MPLLLKLFIRQSLTLKPSRKLMCSAFSQQPRTLPFRSLSFASVHDRSLVANEEFPNNQQLRMALNRIKSDATKCQNGQQYQLKIVTFSRLWNAIYDNLEVSL